jgi:hypothetical protein
MIFLVRLRLLWLGVRLYFARTTYDRAVICMKFAMTFILSRRDRMKLILLAEAIRTIRTLTRKSS